jgi:lipopolysaccharide transport system permease protein
MIPISIYLSSLVNHLLAVALALAAIAVAGQPLSFSPVRIPLYLALLGLLSIGAGWIVASLQVYLRDTAQFTLVALNLGMWLTPIFMTPEQVPDRFRFLVLLNPLSYAVNAYRSMLLGGAALDLAEFAALAAFAIACFLGGGLVFRQLKRGFADVL